MSELVGQRSLPAVTNEAPLSWPVFLGCSTCPRRHSSGQGDRNPPSKCCVANVWKRIRPKAQGYVDLPSESVAMALLSLRKLHVSILKEGLKGPPPKVRVRRGPSKRKVSTINAPSHTQRFTFSSKTQLSVRNQEVSSPPPSPLRLLVCVLLKTTC